MAELLIPPFWEFADDNGNPLSGGFVYTYSAGTTTPKATYTDSVAATQNANPVVLDSAGRAVIWGTGSYKFVVKDSLGNTIKTVDNVTTYNTLADAVNPYFETFSGDGTQTVFTLSADVGTDSKNVQIWVADGLLENVTNGNFAADSDWTKGAGWTIGSGVATATGAISTALSQTSAETLIAGQAYVLIYTVTRSAGGIIPSIGGQNGTERTASGTYREVIVAGSTQTLAFTGNAFTGTLDDISITPAVSGKPEIQNPSSYTVSGTQLTFTSAPPPGTNNIYINSPSLLLGAASNAAAAAEAAQTAAEAAEAAANADAAAAASSAAAAASSAADSAASAAQLQGTSATSIVIGIGTKVFTTQSGKLFNGENVRVYSSANAANYMDGLATYSGTSLSVDVTAIGGSGTFTDWVIKVNGARGATGPAGSISDGDKGDIIVTGSGATWTIDGGVITAAARTVLDDTTVAAMVDTLGGASSTGTGGLVRTTSPVLVTPALGTPSSGDLSNCTGFPSSGTYKLLGTTTTAGGETTIPFDNTYLNGIYNDFMLIVSKLGAGVSTSARIVLRASADNGLSFITPAGSNGQVKTTGTTGVVLNYYSNVKIGGTIGVYNVNDISDTIALALTSGATGSSSNTSTKSGSFASGSSVNFISLAWNGSATFAAGGVVSLYGIIT